MFSGKVIGMTSQMVDTQILANIYQEEQPAKPVAPERKRNRRSPSVSFASSSISMMGMEAGKKKQMVNPNELVIQEGL